MDLTIFFNELCVPAIAPDAAEHEWRSSITEFINVMAAIKSVRQPIRIGFVHMGLLVCGAKTLRDRVKEACTTRDQYRGFLSLAYNAEEEYAEVNSSREVRFGGAIAVGLALADVQTTRWKCGWAISFPLKGSPWDAEILPIERTSLSADGNLIGPEAGEIGHFCSIGHVAHWTQSLEDWGAAVASSCEVGELHGRPIVMYPGPKEHGPPHVHLLESRTNTKTLAKYRIDVFERPLGKPTFDREMRDWVEKYRDQLMRSWARCQKGGHPYKLE